MRKIKPLTLGKLIEKIDNIIDNRKESIEALVFYDFCNLYPASIHSWRGNYHDVALDYDMCKYAAYSNNLSLKEFHTLLKDTIGKIFTGYKGGDYKMTKESLVWADCYGECSRTAIIDVIDVEDRIVLVTKYICD